MIMVYSCVFTNLTSILGMHKSYLLTNLISKYSGNGESYWTTELRNLLKCSIIIVRPIDKNS